MVKKKPEKVSQPAVAKKAVPKKAAKKAAAKKTVSKNTATKKAASKKVVPKTAVKKATAKKTAKTAKPPGKRTAKKTKNDEECFLTTACVRYYALSDDAYELKTLRAFRDQYMLQSKQGRALVKHYYRIAPLIVSLIKRDKAHKHVYQYIYQSIQKACSEIEQKNYAIAQQTYTSLVTHLTGKYSVKS